MEWPLPTLIPDVRRLAILARNRPFGHTSYMSNGYRGGGTTGGRWGCGLAFLIGFPLFAFLLFITTFGDCVPDEQCHGSVFIYVVLPTALAAALFGFGSRAIINRAIQKRNQRDIR